MRSLTLILIPVVIGASGCVPERIAWSPDGRNGLVTSGNKVFGIRDDGAAETVYSGHVEGFSLKNTLTSTAWLDSERYVVTWSSPVKHWADIEPILGDDRAELVRTAAKRIRAQLDQFQGDWGDLHVDADISRSEALAAWMYLRDTDSDAVAEALGGRWSSISDLTIPIVRIEVRHISDSESTTGERIYESVDPIFTMRVSPDAAYLAVVVAVGCTGDDDPASGVTNQPEGRMRLDVVSTNEPSDRKTVDWDVSFWPCWSQSGDRLFYIKSLTSGRPFSEVSQPGRLMHWWKEEQASKETSSGAAPSVDVVFHPFTKLFSLPSGHLLLPSIEATFPNVATNERRIGLYVLEPDGVAGLSKIPLSEVSKDIEVALALGSIAASPDGKQLAITTGNGRTGLIHLRTGRIEWLQPTPIRSEKSDKNRTWLTTAPAWKGDDALTFVAPPGSEYATASRPEVVLWSPTRTSVLSLSWKSEEFGEFLRSP